MKALAYHTIQALINTVRAKSPEAPKALKKLQDHSKDTKVKTALKHEELRFNKDMQIVPIGTHGGERDGAGRPAVRGQTIVKRIPERYKDAVDALIKHLDGTSGNDGASGHISNIKCRNLNDSLITLQFQSKSKESIM